MASTNLEFLGGMLCIIGIIHCWVGSSTLIQYVYAEVGFSKPLFVTFFNALVSSVNLLPFLYDARWQSGMKKSWRKMWLRKPDECASGATEGIETGTDNESPLPKRGAHSLVVVTEDDDIPSDTAPLIATDGDKQALEEELPHEIFVVAMLYSLVYVPGSYSLNLSLCAECGTGTSVASATVLSTAHSLWTLLLAIPLLGEYPAGSDYLAVVLCVSGAVCVAGSDFLSGGSLVGDCFGCFTAFCFGLQPVLLQRWDVGNYQMFYGFVAIGNLLMCLPVMVLLHFQNIETFAPIPLDVLGYLALNGAAILLANQMFGLAVRWTNPTVVNIGTSMCIPLAICSDLFNPFTAVHPEFKLSYLLGTVLILSSLALVCVPDSLPEEEEEEAIPVAVEAATMEMGTQTEPDTAEGRQLRALLNVMFRNSFFTRFNSSFVPCLSHEPNKNIMKQRTFIRRAHIVKHNEAFRRIRTAPTPNNRKPAAMRRSISSKA